MQQTWKDYLCLTECTRLCVKRSGPAALLVYTVRKGYGHLKKLIIRLSVLLLATGSLLLQSGIASADEKIDKPSNTPTFVGIMSSSHIEALESLKNCGLLEGIDTEIILDDEMTRGTFIAALLKVHRMLSLEGNPNPYKDISKEDFYYDAVTWATAHKLVRGKTSDTFAPNEPITRQEVAFITSKFISFFGMPLEKRETNAFIDQSSISDWALRSSAKVNSHRLMIGYKDHKFAPLQPISNADGLLVISRLNEELIKIYKK